MIGSSLSHFRITAKLGEGGMGEVYRAEDSKLGREVAIKVLPEAVANDPERLARFEREAKVLASLNHPNIAGIYQVEEVAGKQLLVMELAAGEDLKERIERGAVPVQEALQIALQIARALEAAHERGVIHRDLKPANIKVGAHGEVKVLDFGLAKALEIEAASGSVQPALTQSPTLTAQMTGAGVLLGTAAYMSPEQARGETADRRADIWAFGVVLFEMLTGKMAYTGKTVSDTLAGVLRADPEWDDLPADTPHSIRSLLARCLDKEVDERLQAIGEARITIEHYLENPQAERQAEAAAGSPGMASTWRQRLPWALLALALLGLGGALWRIVSLPAPESKVLKATIPPADGTRFHLHPFTPGPAAISPDGSRIVFAGVDDNGEVLLYLRELDAGQAHAISGTQGAQYPFWSPDSRWIGFFTNTDRTLKKIDAAGGPPLTLCAANDGKGGSWSSEGVIIFAPSADQPIHRVAAAGGESTPVTELDPAKANSHRQPRFLPDGRHFLYIARASGGQENSLMLGSLAGDVDRALLETPSQGEVASGKLLFIRDQTLMAQDFDEERLELVGEAAPLAEQVLQLTGAAVSAFSASGNGVLVYQTGDVRSGSNLEWRDRAGGPAIPMGDPAPYRQAVVSPDGSLAAVTIEDPANATHDIWIFEVERGIRTRFTFDAGDDDHPVWAPDSQSLVFTSDRSGEVGLYRKAIGGVGEVELLHVSPESKRPTSISPDNGLLAFDQESADSSSDIWILPLGGGGEPWPFRQTEFGEDTAHFSPDGQWLSYDSDESGTWQAYVTPFPGPGRRWQVSGESGHYNNWGADGREILYQRTEGQLEAVAIETGEDSLRIGRVTPLFALSPPAAGGAWYSPGPGATRFLVVGLTDSESSALLNLVVNWPQDLARR